MTLTATEGVDRAMWRPHSPSKYGPPTARSNRTPPQCAPCAAPICGSVTVSSSP